MKCANCSGRGYLGQNSGPLSFSADFAWCKDCLTDGVTPPLTPAEAAELVIRALEHNQLSSGGGLTWDGKRRVATGLRALASAIETRRAETREAGLGAKPESAAPEGGDAP